MNNRIKLSAGLLAAVMAVSAVFLVGCIPEDDPLDTDVGEVPASESIRIEPEENPFITVSVSPVTVSVVNNKATLKQTLTATLQPATVENKKVDWTVAWADSSGAGDVTDYVTVTPEEDGSPTVTVTCYQPFTGEIVITVITRDGGFTARCICEYVGHPTSLAIEPTGAAVVSDGQWGVSVAELKSGSTYYFDLLPSNVFGSTGSVFSPVYTVAIRAFGGMDTIQKNYDSSGSVTGTLKGTVELTVADLTDTEGYAYAYFPKTGGIHTVVSVRIENGKLKLEAKDDPAAYTWTTGNQLGSAICSFDGYTDGRVPYVAVTVTEKTTGLTQTVYVRTVSAVQSVTLSRTRVSF